MERTLPLPDWEADALPTELHPRIGRRKRCSTANGRFNAAQAWNYLAHPGTSFGGSMVAEALLNRISEDICDIAASLAVTRRSTSA